MGINDILNNQQSEIKKDKEALIQTLKDLVKQTDGTVQLIKVLTDKHGKNALLAELTTEEQTFFNLIWTKINEAAANTDYVVPTLSDTAI